ncbi:hypothetical protein B0H13DRAFT_2381307 [Mycena leptocephala]|nr:hypothetical protein B0H13DRAFT_2381307 [Mycena leptocephala]
MSAAFILATLTLLSFPDNNPRPRHARLQIRAHLREVVLDPDRPSRSLWCWGARRSIWLMCQWGREWVVCSFVIGSCTSASVVDGREYNGDGGEGGRRKEIGARCVRGAVRTFREGGVLGVHRIRSEPHSATRRDSCLCLSSSLPRFPLPALSPSSSPSPNGLCSSLPPSPPSRPPLPLALPFFPFLPPPLPY